MKIKIDLSDEEVRELIAAHALQKLALPADQWAAHASVRSYGGAEITVERLEATTNE